MQRVVLITTGGTMQALGRDRLHLAAYQEEARFVDDAELLREVPEIGGVAQVEHRPFRRLFSSSLQPADWLALRTCVEDVLTDSGVAGVVITHGTNTLEETAYFLHLTVRTARPVVLVGAMRPASAMSRDGDLNLVNAVRVAAAAESQDMGVLAVLNELVYSARDVTKTLTNRIETFQGRDQGALGYADVDGRVVYYHRPVRTHTMASEFDVRRLSDLPRVDIVLSYAGSDAVLIEAAVAAGARGIVLAGTGGGIPTPSEAAALARARRGGVAVCLASRVGAGRVTPAPAWEREGFVTSDNLQPWKARVLLALALTRSDAPEYLQGIFDRY